MKILVTGGAGFIGANLVRHLLGETDHGIVNLDKLTYAGNLQSLAGLEEGGRHAFERVDLCDPAGVAGVLARHRPDAVLHLAAESHVDRSIDGPAQFVQTNVVGTFHLLQAALQYWQGRGRPEQFRFVHVSTDEVFGSLGFGDAPFSEQSRYDPHSPYAASKAAADHFARSWRDTFGLPVVVTNCSNNYGPYQFPEKLVPVVLLQCLRREPVPVYGKGENVRDWLYVEDHVRALRTVLEEGRAGETYAIGGGNERSNLELVRELCALMDERHPWEEGGSRRSHAELITFVADRPGHDLRYAIDSSKIREELGWRPRETFASGMRKTVDWYLENRAWWEAILSGEYRLTRLGNPGAGGQPPRGNR